ncbi:FAD/NAD(P)-binding domain-containing protein [Exidia glandulosa HHB12029]|uniref:FAD/NAD(P)-binding domain-containing protein n=1 Tax=Exidia glandulosa HHB12029 TaxID=1314781 RepID=A0A165M411_EXIGL|nr:FAD/NAD(P)-binding domain-containing protein [Exidia glandulosa HHB12029]
MASAPVRVAVIGAGLAGLITAKTLLDDGFNVQVLTRDESVGGVWCRSRVYPGLRLNNVHGEYHFSALPMPPPKDTLGGRLSGEEVTTYLEAFAGKFLKDRIMFAFDVKNIVRGDLGSGWDITVQPIGVAQRQSVMHFDKIVVCTGGSSSPSVPRALSESRTRFRGPVCHSQDVKHHVDQMVSVAGSSPSHLAATFFANKGCAVRMIFEEADHFLASPFALPEFIRKSRFLPIMSCDIDLNSRLERFLHTTKIGSYIVHGFWNALHAGALLAFGIPRTSPIATTHSAFWSIRVNDEGAGSDNDFYSHVRKGDVKLVAPARAATFGEDEESVILQDGRVVQACAVVLATGWTSSWDHLFADSTMRDIGLERRPLPPGEDIRVSRSYVSLSNAPMGRPHEDSGMSAFHRGLVPVKSLDRRDFAVNGAVFTTGPAYTFELPPEEEAEKLAERQASFIRARYPEALAWVNESFSSGINLFTWPQHVDRLLADMGLKTCRSGGNWLTWPFKVIQASEIATLHDERENMRALSR